MAGRDSSKGAHAYEAEAGWCENVTTFGTRTPVLDRIDVTGLKRAKLAPARVVQLLNGGTLYIPGPIEAEFKTSYYLAGHGSGTTGAVAATVLPTLLKFVLGYAPAAPAGTTISAGWNTVTGNVGASGTFPAGWLGFFGAPRDGRAGGHPGLFASHIGNAVTLLNALPAAPNNTDLLHSSECNHTPATPSDAQMAITGTRHILFTADQVYRTHGCWPKAMAFRQTQTGEAPIVDVTWGASYFVESTATFPSALSTDNFVAAVNGGGSLHVGVKGVTTRDLVDYRNLEININLGVQPVPGPGAVFGDLGQKYVGARRIPGEMTLGFSDDAESAGLTPKWMTRWQAEQFYTIVLAFNLIAGKRFALAAVNACAMGDQPTQDTQDNLNVTKPMFRLHDDDTGATELAKSGLRLFHA